jgi:hypothetical protein
LQTKNFIPRINLAILFALLIVIAVTISKFTLLWVAQSDFPGFFVLAEIIDKGLYQNLYNFEIQRELQKHSFHLAFSYNPSLYPPWAAILFSPLIFFSPTNAYLIFILINFLSLILSIQTISKHFNENYFHYFGLILLFPPCLISIFQSQITGIVLFILVKSVISIELKKFKSAALWCSLLLIKPQYFLVIFIFSIFRVSELKHAIIYLYSTKFFILFFGILSFIFYYPLFIDIFKDWIIGLKIFSTENLSVNLSRIVSLKGILDYFLSSTSFGKVIKFIPFLVSLYFAIKFRASKNWLPLVLISTPFLSQQSLFYDLTISIFGILILFQNSILTFISLSWILMVSFMSLYLLNINFPFSFIFTLFAMMMLFRSKTKLLSVNNFQ